MNSMVIFHSYVNVYQRVLGTDGEISCTLCGKDGDILCTSAKLMDIIGYNMYFSKIGAVMAMAINVTISYKW